MDINKLYDKDQGFTYNGETVYFVRLLSSKRHMMIAKPRASVGDIVVTHQRLPVTKLPIEILMDIGIWDTLSSEVQSEMKFKDDMEAEAIKNKMAHARGQRKKKYEGWPDEVECTTCNHKQKINKTQLAKKMDKDAGLTIEKFIAEYRCQTCNPTKGRRKKA
jgi:hypothetical protein